MTPFALFYYSYEADKVHFHIKQIYITNLYIRTQFLDLANIRIQ